MYIYIYGDIYADIHIYRAHTHTHSLMTSSETDTEYGYFQCGRMFYILLKLFLTQYLSSMISENKGILGNSQHMMVKKLWMTKRGILQGVAVVCLYKVRGVSSFCPLANTKFLKQQDSECTTKSITKLLFKRRNLCVL